MHSGLIAGLAIAVVGIVVVILPVVMQRYRAARGKWIVECPETEAAADVTIDAKHAAFTAALGSSDIRVGACSRWPEHSGCDQACVR